MKKLMPENIQYWINKGFTYENAILKANNYSRYPGSFKYYLCRNITEDENQAHILANEWIKEKCPVTKNNRLKKFNGDEEAYKKWMRQNCNLSKENMLKTMSEDDYKSYKHNLGKKLIGKRLEHWMNKGYTECEARKIISNNTKLKSKRCIEYWIDKGYTIEESIIQVSKYQNNNSINKFIGRFGEIDGKIKYDEWKYGQKIGSIRSYLHWMNKGYSKEESLQIVSKIQKDFSNLQPKLLTYWMNKGYSKEEAALQSKDYSRRMSYWCAEYWMDKGYSKEESVQIVSKIQKDFSNRGLLSYNHCGNLIASKLELNVRNHLIMKNYDVITDYMVNDIDLDRIYYPDIYIKDVCFIEVYGDYWHGNLNKYKLNDIIISNVTVEIKQKNDKVRIDRICNITNLPVYVLWESDILSLGLDFVLKQIKELNYENKENNLY